jgi:mono/diheme cytochrome c family protein
VEKIEMIKYIGCFLTELFILVLLSTVAVAERPETPAQTPVTIEGLPDFSISRGGLLYERYCAFCHGRKGRGDGLNSYNLPVKPADFNERWRQNRRSYQSLKSIIAGGGPSAGLSQVMPAYGSTFSEEEIREIIGYLDSMIGK